MEKKVHVSVRGKQKNEFDSDEISFECLGRLIEKNGTFYINGNNKLDKGWRHRFAVGGFFRKKRRQYIAAGPYKQKTGRSSIY